MLTFSIKSTDSHPQKRLPNQLRQVVRYLAKSAAALTIPDLAVGVRISIPTCTKLIRELLDGKWVLEVGKKETENGRRPEQYTLNKEKFYAVGVEVLLKWIHVSIVRIDSVVRYEASNENFVLEDSPACLTAIINFVQAAMTQADLQPDQLIGVGVGMAGTVNGHTGESTLFFNSLDRPLAKYLETALQLPVLIDTDTRVIGIAEQVLGKAKGVENALIVKISRSLGLSIILNSTVVFGAKGFAGEFGHLQMGKKNRLCTCGKRGCLETEVSGVALLKDLEEALLVGETSTHFQAEHLAIYRYHDVIRAALKGDALSIQLIINQGDKLGQALGSIINLLNPELIVIGGEYVKVIDYFLDAVKIGTRKTGLMLSLANCVVDVSSLGGNLSSKAGACLVFKRYELTP